MSNELLVPALLQELQELIRPPKLHRIHFDGCDFWLPITWGPGFDADIEEARRVAECRAMKDLPENPRTGFPSFTIYEISEVAGG